MTHMLYCEVCGVKTSPATRCTNNRCLDCHGMHCGEGGRVSPGHGRGTQPRRFDPFTGDRVAELETMAPQTAYQTGLQHGRENRSPFGLPIGTSRADGFRLEKGPRNTDQYVVDGMYLQGYLRGFAEAQVRAVGAFNRLPTPRRER